MEDWQIAVVSNLFIYIYIYEFIDHLFVYSDIFSYLSSYLLKVETEVAPDHFLWIVMYTPMKNVIKKEKMRDGRLVDISYW